MGWCLLGWWLLSTGFAPTQKLKLITKLERRLLFGGFERQDQIQRVLNLVEVAISDKLNPSTQETHENLEATSLNFQTLLQNMLIDSSFDQNPKPWHSPFILPCARALESAASDIREELLAAIVAPKLNCTLDDKDKWDGAEYKSIAPEWEVLHLWRNGEWNESVERILPRTVAILRNEVDGGRLCLNPLQNVACAIAKQPAGSGISSHCDGNIVGLTAHLGLDVPTNCWITVGGERRSWEQGRLLLFDTTFMHETFNGGSSDRFVLMLNVLRPGVSEIEVEALRHYTDFPAPRLDILNPFYMWVGESVQDRRLQAHAEAGDIFVAPLPVEVNAEGLSGIQVRPGRWLPLYAEDVNSERDEGGNMGSSVPSGTGAKYCRPPKGDCEGDLGLQEDTAGRRESNSGLVMVVPFTGKSFKVVSPCCVQPLMYPHRTADSVRDVVADGESIEPVVAAVDPKGVVQWLGLAANEETKRLASRDKEFDVDGRQDEFGVSTSTLEAHLSVMEDVSSALMWMPLYGPDGDAIFEEEIGRESRDSVGFGVKEVQGQAKLTRTKRRGHSRAKRKSKR